MTIRNLIRVSRPKQWVKQLFIVLPCIAFGTNIQFQNIEFALIAVLNFTLVSISVYIFNDIADREEDRHDVTKSKRPIASGALKVGTARRFAWVSLIFGYLIIVLYPENNILILGLVSFYLSINFFYTK